MIDADRDILILGALLHDIGKFRMRAQEKPTTQDHSQWGAEWLQEHEKFGLPKSVATMAEWHHKKVYQDVKLSNATLLVYQADNLASGAERIQKKGQFEPVNTPLRSVLSTIRLHLDEKSKEANSIDPPPAYYPLQKLSLQLILPDERSDNKAGREKYAALWEEFEQEFKVWCQKGCSIDELLILLEKYTSFIPSETEIDSDRPKDNPDISLFDHLKMTAAIALALYQNLQEQHGSLYNQKILEKEILDTGQDQFLFLGGDLSGVQKFIYTISSRGALKTLRARSFYLEILSEHLVSQTLQAAGLSRANTIYIGGGRFYLLAPNTEEVRTVWKKLAERTNRWLFQNFGGQLMLVTAAVPFAGQNLQTRKIAELWQKLADGLAAGKQHKYDAVIRDFLTPKDPIMPDLHCQVCHRDDVYAEPCEDDPAISAICPLCENLRKLGGLFPRLKTVRMTSQPEGKTLRLAVVNAVNDAPLFLEFLSDLPQECKDDEILYLINSLETEKLHAEHLVPLFVSRYVKVRGQLRRLEKDDPGDPHAIAGFPDLARQARGKSMIAALRMDVDRLGQIFAQGLPEDRRTLTRMAGLSRQLSLFFKVYLDRLLAGETQGLLELHDLSKKEPKENGRNVCTIYSGGDDLFLVGAWDEIAEVALDIHDAFSRFSGHNPYFTLSGGFVVQKENFPLYKLADLAHAAEQTAKNAGRDRLTLFYEQSLQRSGHNADYKLPQTLSWKEIPEKVVEPLQLFLDCGEIDYESNRYKSRLISHSLVNKLFQVLERWQAEGILYLPSLAYLLGRLKKEVKQEQAKRIRPLIEAMMVSEKLPQWRNALMWLDLMSRSE
ncbi:MAG TPA: type III-A CRISPR-associated protein Cas10/Csm1 [bacterium]|nr:type III-A CRISPR-associated protein Cas10/Csm1 [bacterium]HNT67332.1 type III-A CRISPR-associated protein Cas10/Csm1 [bacterium]